PCRPADRPARDWKHMLRLRMHRGRAGTTPSLPLRALLERGERRRPLPGTVLRGGGRPLILLSALLHGGGGWESVLEPGVCALLRPFRLAKAPLCLLEARV